MVLLSLASAFAPYHSEQQRQRRRAISGSGNTMCIAPLIDITTACSPEFQIKVATKLLNNEKQKLVILLTITCSNGQNKLQCLVKNIRRVFTTYGGLRYCF
jgi:hypothetical protein